jgi:hypothetical protein
LVARAQIEKVKIDPHLSPDAPLIHLISLKHNPLVVEMSQEHLIELVKRIRELDAMKAAASSTKRKRCTKSPPAIQKAPGH